MSIRNDDQILGSGGMVVYIYYEHQTQYQCLKSLDTFIDHC
jgi:hypothetical protein